MHNLPRIWYATYITIMCTKYMHHHHHHHHYHRHHHHHPLIAQFFHSSRPDHHLVIHCLSQGQVIIFTVNWYINTSRNTRCNFEKYIWQFGQIYYSVWLTIIWSSIVFLRVTWSSSRSTDKYFHKYILQFWQIHLAFWKNTIGNLNQYSLRPDYPLVIHHLSQGQLIIFTVNW